MAMAGLAAVFWGSMGVAGQYLLQNCHFTPMDLISIRMLLAGSIFVGIEFFLLKKGALKVFETKQNIIDLIIYTLTIIGTQLTFFVCIQYANAPFAAVLTATVPLWIMIFMVVFQHKRLTVKEVFCGLVAYVLFYWNKKTVWGSVLYALPVAGMLVDTINNCMKFYYSQTNLANSILGIIFLLIMFVVLFKKVDKKCIFVFVLIVVALIGFILFPTTSQSITMESTITCELGSETEVFYIKMRDDGKILEIEGDETVYEEIDINSLKTIPEVVHALQNYYESKGGAWKME